MTALLVYAYPADAFNVPPDFAVVADDTHFGYVVPKGRSATSLNRRVEVMEQQAGEGTTTAADWLRVGTTNMNYMRFTEIASAESFEAAVKRATQYLADDDTEEQTP